VTRDAAGLAGTGPRDGVPAAASAPSEEGDGNVSITVTPGATEIVRIASGYLNRVITPFPNPKLLSANALEVQKEGSSLYIAGPIDRPVGVYVLSNDPDDTRGISLTLVPARIPPRTVTLKWPEGTTGGSIAASSARAKRWEESASYEETLLQLVQTIAMGEVPEGYSLTDTKVMPACALPGVRIAPGQRLSGSHFSAFVLRVTNTSHSVLELPENAGCNVPGVVVVAPWPYARLEAGASTELYVVVLNDVFDPPAASRVRHSLLTR
jgi:conjugal transfer pilus assembly protein TraK